MLKYSNSESEDCYIATTSAEHDEMPHVAAFRLALHCLLKYLFMVSSITRGDCQFCLRKIWLLEQA